MGGVKQALGYGWALTLPPFFSVPLPQAGAYYPAQGVQQFPTGVAPAPVLMNQPPQIAPKRERKTVSSSEGLRDIWEGENQGQMLLGHCAGKNSDLRKELRVGREWGLWRAQILCKILRF